MSCCDNSKHNCRQGRDCKIQHQAAHERSERIQAWLLRNQSLISNSSVLIAAVIWVALWVIS